MKEIFGKVLAVLLSVTAIIGTCTVTSSAAVKEYPFNVCYDDETARIYNKDGKGFLFGFDYDKDDDFWYTPVNPWQRKFGYSEIYDELAIFIGCYYDTVRVYFEYEDKEWLVQYWKGIYGYTSGAEIGIYNRPTGSRGSFYKCVTDEEMPFMKLTVKRGDEVFIAQPQQKHWWMTGFVLPSQNSAESLYCEMMIDSEDAEFAKLLANGLKENGFTAKNSVKVKGTSVTLCW